MSVRHAVLDQYRATVDRAGVRGQLAVPREGWLRTVRKALGMSGADLAARLGVTRARVSHVEASELAGGLTIRTMKTFAEALGCEFVYAIVPKSARIDDVIMAQARAKAEAIVARAGSHMALEDQAVSPEAMRRDVERTAGELAATIPPGFWKGP